MAKSNLSCLYSEDTKEVTVTTFCDRNVVTKTILDKSTGCTIVEIYKEGNDFPIERYVYNTVV